MEVHQTDRNQNRTTNWDFLWRSPLGSTREHAFLFSFWYIVSSVLLTDTYVARTLRKGYVLVSNTWWIPNLSRHSPRTCMTLEIKVSDIFLNFFSFADFVDTLEHARTLIGH